MVAPDLTMSQDALLGSRGCHDERSIFAVFGGSIYDFFSLVDPTESGPRSGLGRAGRKMGLKDSDLHQSTKCFPHEECERREEQRGRGSCFWNLWHCERRVSCQNPVGARVCVQVHLSTDFTAA